MEKKLVAKCKKTGIIINDAENISGSLTKHIKLNYPTAIIPNNNYQRKKYQKENNKKWYEEYFDIIEIDDVENRKCKLCDWTTIDVNNKTGCFENHIKNNHNIELEEYLNIFPEDIPYHPTFIKSLERNNELKNKNNYIICNLCGNKFKSITNTHLLNVHNITIEEYKLQYPNNKIVSNNTSKILSDNTKELNKHLTPTWESKGELEIKEFLENLGLSVSKNKNRKLLDGKEIDLVIDDFKICIEYNGLYYHTEKMGKNSNYHLNKTLSCNEIGYSLIHIFEDEWINSKELVKNKLKHLLNKNNGIRIGARKTIIKQIHKNIKGDFLNKNHIQGNDKSNIFYGAYYNNELIGVMTFNSKRNMTKSKDGEYELSRFCVNSSYIVSGLASKLLKQFINDYKPKSIISFADRRWTSNSNNNLYTKLGFNLISIVKPKYYYYNSKINKYKRYHKFAFGKNNLKKRYPNIDLSKSEKQITEELGFDKIWDCGLFKYELLIKY